MSEYGVVTGLRTIRMERLLPGPIERVWDYLTNSTKRGTWFATGKMELRAGGRVEFFFNHADLSAEKTPPERHKNKTGGVSVTGTVTACKPPYLLSFNFGGTGEVTFELAPKGKDVLLVLTHRKLKDRAMMVGVASGWHSHLAILIDVLKGDEPHPFWTTVTRLETEYEKRIPQA